MNSMFAFVILDLLSLKQYRKVFFFMPLLAVLMSWYMKADSIAAILCLLCSMIACTYLFSIQEKNLLDTLYCTLSLKRSNIVIARYLSVFCIEMIAYIVGLLLITILHAFSIGIDSFRGDFIALNVGLFAISFFVSFQIPFFFRLGYQKAALIAYIPFFLPMLLISATLTLPFDIFEFVRGITNGFILYGLPVIAGIGCLGLSCMISCRLYRQKNL